ncbi:hypothetical protein RJ45_20415 [Photobacterium gaetbulicola]|uniref:Outer membrane protein beta-barrel domain-containing protein n=1 Tax=Photobacterium gaetbulicola TaxID=1295392 RepID=A0A0B9FZY7_9GAMM|nr:hypothetical protein [Photobacterium gaetbulicola]KHT61899.1 hypothetical protein RJ45_20415 [Photobacterium gaetbulicola]
MKFKFLLLAALVSPFSFAQQSFFPIWGDEAEKLGYTLPKPYGFSLSYMDMSNPITVNSIALNGHPLLEAIDVDANHADFTGSNITLRGDVWIFPFMNLYGILGYTQGTSKAKINSLSCDSSSLSGFENKALCGLVNLVGGNLPDDVMFELDMDGGTYGIGTTLAGGVGNWFALVDMNYTYTKIAAIDGSIKTFVAAPRVGHRWEYDGGRELRVFVGAMYQDVQQELSGDLKSLNLPDFLDPIIDSTPDAGFEVSQSADEKWNGIVGFQYAFNRDWDILMEAGFGDRETLFFALGRRF